MIGVIASPSEECAVREFFELFKTPWETYRAGRRYDVVVCADDAGVDRGAARVLLQYSSRKTAFDTDHAIEIHNPLRRPVLGYGQTRLPIYGDGITFRHQGTSLLKDENSREPAAYAFRLGDQMAARIGYDLFREVRFLLGTGQPSANAIIPALELHVEFLRNLICGCGISLLEVPPVPDGYSFIACLTHDVDHASIRRHRLDPTVLGFFHRAILGSVANAVRGRLSLRKLFTNWAAAAKVPFIHLGLVADFWYEFDRYLEVEKGKPSTFFVIPFEGRPGWAANGPAPRKRASRYDVSHIAPKLPRLIAAGCEIGLHGIDAWADSSKGQEEAKRIMAFSGAAEIGVRMHWLFRDRESPVNLENAGFSYDSTVGYNETTGYRAGTCQAFKPLEAERLLELPMHVMDTAMFYPDHLGLSAEEAREWLVPVLDNAHRHGGALTLNWHDRSIAPERLWGDFYASLLDDLAARGVWFANAAQTVSWFRKRRAVTFERLDTEGDRIRVKIPVNGDPLPNLRLRLYQAHTLPDSVPVNASVSPGYCDAGVTESTNVHVPNGKA